MGHDEIVHGVLTCLFVGGHCLLEGVPGLGKTLLVRTLADALDLDFSRIQFTPDLMPADILGTNMVVETPERKTALRIPEGPDLHPDLSGRRNQPRHAQDAIRHAGNDAGRDRHGRRRSLRVAAALLRHGDAKPDRTGRHLPACPRRSWTASSSSLVVGYSDARRTGHDRRPHDAGRQMSAEKVMDGDEIIKWQKLIREVILAEHVQDYHRTARTGHPSEGTVRRCRSPNQYLRWGASPRGAQTLGPGRQSPAPCWKVATTSVSKTSAVSICPPCGTA